MSRVTVLLPLALFFLAGCSGQGANDPELRQFIAEAGLDSKTKMDPLPAVQIFEPFPYDSAGLEDPFKARNLRPMTSLGGNFQPDINRPKELLEEFPLDALRMVGQVQQKGTRYAIIRTPDGSLHRITKGARIGQNHGKVMAIHEETGLEILEIIQDSAGDWSETTVTLSTK